MTILTIFLLFSSSPAFADTIKVVASFSILGDMAHEVAGDNADITTLVGPDSDAHMYEPSPTDAKAVAQADIFLVNGLGFEGWLDKLVAASGYKGHVVTASEGITPRQLDGVPDPHAWQNVENARIYIINIRNALSRADPVHAEKYRVNASNYLHKLELLDSWIREQISTIPGTQRKLITTHDAFGYFGNAYDVKLYAPLGMNTESEPSAADIARLIDQMREQRIRALFMENITDSRLIRQLEADGGAYIGGTLYSDALSPPGGPAGTYLLMFRHNVALMIDGMRHNP